MGKRVTLEAVKQGRYSTAVNSAFFSEGKRKVWFGVGRQDGFDYLRCVKPGRGFFDKDKTIWLSKEQVLRNSVYQYNAYTVQQLKDTTTGRYYYAIECWFAMDATYRAYLIGYDPEGKKMVEYINSRTMVPKDHRDMDLMVIRNKLYLHFQTLGLPPGDYYQIDWNPSANWFGYALVAPPQR